MSGLLLQTLAMLSALAFCTVRFVADLRARRFGWAAASAIVGAVLLWASMMPVQTHAIKVDLPVAS